MKHSCWKEVYKGHKNANDGDIVKCSCGRSYKYDKIKDFWTQL